jgi:hypothetical protein
MEYTITFTPKSVARKFCTSEEFVIEHWEIFENYLENFEYNWMGDVLWDDAETPLLEEINKYLDEKLDEFPFEIE